jgi:co-chaperonin GroES (HSP10)
MDSERKDYVVVAGHKLWMDTKYDAQFKACQEGVIEITNTKLARYGLLEGRRVWFHHFVAGEVGTKTEWISNAEQFNSKKLYKAELSQIFAYEDEQKNIVPILDYTFCFPIKKLDPDYKNTFLIIPDHLRETVVDGVALVLYVSENAAKRGVTPGDTVIYTKNSDYKMTVNNQEVYCIEGRDIVCVVNESFLDNLTVDHD